MEYWGSMPNIVEKIVNRIKNPKTQNTNPKLKIPKHKTQIPKVNPKIQTPKPNETQNPKFQTMIVL